ncbi:hypothetical protein K438DRAFT_1878328 [Mycena galopus ATCC 62051]|nr:hypothetical protein K438DRAFT_1878328 [Mycena galopus ATCC 62051]
MRRTQYLSLPQEDKDLIESPQNESCSNFDLHKLVYWAIVVISVCSAIDVCALMYFAARTSFQSRISVDEMPIRSTYIKLEELYAKKHHKSTNIQPIVNLPKVLQVIDSSQPSQVFPQWSEIWATPHGIVPINDRSLLVTDTASTVAQFRVLDFGMEHCVVTFTIPFQNHTKHTKETFLDVWLLNANGKLNFQELSWKTKPKRDRHLGHFSTTFASTQELTGFPCVSGTYLTIELACQIPGCFFESVATQKDAVGVYLRQHQTI